MLALAAGFGATVRSQTPARGDGETGLESIGVLVPDDRLDPRLVALDLEGAAWERALGELDAALFDRANAERRLDGLRDELSANRLDALVLGRQIDAAIRREAELTQEIDDQRALLQARAVANFVGFGGGNTVGQNVSARAAADQQRARQLTAQADEVQLTRLTAMYRERDGLDRTVRVADDRLVLLDANVDRLRTERENAERELISTGEQVESAVQEVRDARWRALVPDLDIPIVAMDAYLRAETTLAASDPACGLEWWTIAAVGRVESRHGTLGGRRLGSDGRLSRPLVGIALDGGDSVRAIPDTDGGALDSDPRWDRAVGPMQFIPETWQRRGRDGNGDGVADPQNLYDAALTAGRYLCRVGGDLSTATGRRAGWFGYNTSDDYVDEVQTHAADYATLELPPLVGPDSSS